MKSLAITFCVLLALLPAPLWAMSEPHAGNQDPRITYARFQEGQVYHINTRLRTVTLVELGDGERIQSIAIGDLESFKIDRLEGSNVFIIKPVVGGASTNITVETNRHFYFLMVRETGRATPAISVKFTTPARSNRGVAQAPPAQTLRPMTYKMSQRTNTAEFARVRIWDDGRKTYFRFASGVPIPAVFSADAHGREMVVNTSTRGTTVTVGQLSKRWVLRVGGAYACVEGTERRGRR